MVNLSTSSNKKEMDFSLAVSRQGLSPRDGLLDMVAMLSTEISVLMLHLHLGFLFGALSAGSGATDWSWSWSLESLPLRLDILLPYFLPV